MITVCRSAMRKMPGIPIPAPTIRSVYAAMATTASLALVAWSAASVRAHSGVAELDLCPQSVPKRGWGKYGAGSVRGSRSAH